MSNKFDYIKFALMPYQAPSAVSPYTPVALNKVMRKITFSATGVSVPASGVLEGVVAEPLTGGFYSPIGLFYNTVLNSGTSLPAVFGTSKTLSGMPLLNSGIRYVGGYLKLTPNAAMQVTFHSRYYEPNVNSTAYHAWNTISDNGESAMKITNGVVGTSLYIGMSPNDLRYKNIESVAYPYFPYVHHHFKMFNHSTSSNMTLDIMGEWWVETYEPIATVVPFIQDTKCPYKLAEYVIAKLKSAYSHILEGERTAKWNALDAAIQSAIDGIVGPWAVLTSDITISTGIEPVEAETDADWNSRRLIWNP